GSPSRARLDAAQDRVRPADPMMILYSSGSTADPKGAVHSQGTIIRHSYNLLSTRDLRSEDRIWSPMPFFWVGGFVFSLLGSLHTGACILCEKAFDPEQTLLFLERERATIAAGWPHFGQALANHPTAKQRDLSALRAGNLPEFLPESIVPADPELRPNALGMTETCGPHTCVAEGPLPEALRGSHGVAVPGVEHKIVDPNTGKTLPPGETGEICVRGYSLMQRLYKVEREQTFDADGFYHTGDAGYFNPDGVLYFKGRLGDMIKTAGANVTPSEVEQVMNAFPEIAQSYVVGLPDAERGQLVVAAVTLESDCAADPQELRERIKRELSAYKVPRHIFISPEDELPFTDSGKIDKKTLAERLATKIMAKA
ncbi:MAG: long-chain fatty acid--CoA ligase, partial [Deltaproteobacteria bacterium]|nr:long-chain fatty acid--CoA ligase [Deltaproteobacteria bacterium]